MARFRIRIEGMNVGGADGEVIARRLLCAPFHDVYVSPHTWTEFRSLTDDQIEGYVGLLRSRGVHVRYLDILDDKALKSRLLERPLSALVADAEASF
jgi:hypothetical protein